MLRYLLFSECRDTSKPGRFSPDFYQPAQCHTHAWSLLGTTQHTLTCLNSCNIHIIKNAYHMFTCCKSLPLKAELPVNHLFFFFFFSMSSTKHGSWGRIGFRVFYLEIWVPWWCWEHTWRAGQSWERWGQHQGQIPSRETMLNSNLGDTQAQRQVSLADKVHSSLGKSPSVRSLRHPLSSLTYLESPQKSVLNPVAGFCRHHQSSHSYLVHLYVFTHYMHHTRKYC